MLIRPPELKIKCGDLAKAFRELKPECGNLKTFKLERGIDVKRVEYKSKLPALDYLGIRQDCIFCIDKDKEELEYKSASIKSEGNGLLFVLPHIIRDILKVTDKDSMIVMYPHPKFGAVIVCAEGCTWTLNTLPLEEFPSGIFPKCEGSIEPIPEVKQVRPVRNSRKVESNEVMDIDWNLIASITGVMA